MDAVTLALSAKRCGARYLRAHERRRFDVRQNVDLLSARHAGTLVRDSDLDERSRPAAAGAAASVA